MTRFSCAAVLLGFSAFVLAGCGTTAGYTAGGSGATIEVGAQSGGAYSTSEWRFRDGKLQYEIREYGGRGGRRR